jgi:hypothetical protein
MLHLPREKMKEIRAQKEKAGQSEERREQRKQGWPGY